MREDNLWSKNASFRLVLVFHPKQIYQSKLMFLERKRSSMCSITGVEATIYLLISVFTDSSAITIAAYEITCIILAVHENK